MLPSLVPAAQDAILKLNPVGLARNPVIFVTEVVAALRDRALAA